MAQIRLLRKTGTPSSETIIEGGIGIIGSYLTYGPNSGGNSNVGIKVVASTGTTNLFTEKNEFRSNSDDYFSILNSSGAKKTYSKTDGFLYSAATNNDISNSTSSILVTRAYVDATAQGLDVKNSVDGLISPAMATITIVDTQTIRITNWDSVIDGTTGPTPPDDLGKRYLVYNNSGTYAGIYEYAGNDSTDRMFTRASDADSWYELEVAYVFVKYGYYANTGWTCTIESGGTLGTTNITWTQFSGAGTYTADEVTLRLVGPQFSVKPSATVNQYLKTTAAGTTVAWSGINAGDITDGTLSVGRGGTGATTLASGAALIGNGTGAIQTRSITNNTTSTVPAQNTNLVTENTLYNALAQINNATQQRNTTIYAPTAGGAAGQALRAVNATSAPTWETVADSTSAAAIGTGSTLVTERDIYYGLPTINNAHNYTSSTTIYAPSGAGTSGQALISAGGSATPTWGTLGTSYGGTGLTSLGTANQLLRVNSGATALEYFTPTWTSNTGTVTSVAAGNGMNFTTITATGTVTLGTPSSLTDTTTNATTTNSHTHAITNYALSGTANQITITGASKVLGAAGTISLPSTMIAPGTLSAVTSISAPVISASNRLQVYKTVSSNTTAYDFEPNLGTGEFTYTISNITPTADRTINFPNATGTVALTSNLPTGFTISAASDVLAATGGTNATTYSAATVRTDGKFYRHADNPNTTTALKYGGTLYAYSFEGIVDGGTWT